MSETSWAKRLFSGLRRTSEKVTESVTTLIGIGQLDEATLDSVEDALIATDLGAATSARGHRGRNCSSTQTRGQAARNHRLPASAGHSRHRRQRIGQDNDDC
jgi:hypothetical protein